MGESWYKEVTPFLRESSATTTRWEPLVPSGLAVVDEDAEVLFKPLIRAFGLAVRLGVVGGAYVLFDIEDAA